MAEKQNIISITTITALIVAVTLIFGAIAVRNWPSSRAITAGELLFDTYDFNAGETKALQVSHDFTFRNVGRAPVTIGELLTTCTCTVGTLQVRTYPPGSQGTIHVNMKLGPIGRNTHEVAVPVDYSKKPIVLTVQADYRPPIQTTAVPANPILRPQRSLPIQVVMQSSDPERIGIKAITSKNGSVSAKLVSTTQPFFRGVYALHETDLTIELKVDKIGANSDVLNIEFDSVKASPLTVPVRIDTVTNLTVDPQEVLILVQHGEVINPTQRLVIQLPPDVISPSAEITNPFSDWLSVSQRVENVQSGQCELAIATRAPPKSLVKGHISVSLLRASGTDSIDIPVVIRAIAE